jgi:16S rRNA (guanine966-N2)-methyltransferase
MVRVIAGISKGRKLQTPKGKEIRLTLDKVKGAIFNMLGNTIIGSSVLDLFSGTGSLGIEALSRGAGKVTFIEDNNNQIRIINENLKICGFNAEVIKGEVFKMFEKLAGMKFDIILADPPYNKDLAKKILLQLAKYNILKNSSFAVIEHSKREQIEEAPCWQRIRERRYGDTIVSVYKYNDSKKNNSNLSGNI